MLLAKRYRAPPGLAILVASNKALEFIRKETNPYLGGMQARVSGINLIKSKPTFSLTV